MACEESAERRHWTFTQGDEWRRSWTRTSGSRTYDDASLLVQIRAGDSADAVLVASSNPSDVVGDVLEIDISATDFAADDPVFEWEIIGSTSGVDPHVPLWFQAECEIDGRLTTFLTHRMWVEPEIAVAEVGS